MSGLASALNGKRLEGHDPDVLGGVFFAVGLLLPVEGGAHDVGGHGRFQGVLVAPAFCDALGAEVDPSITALLAIPAR